MIPTIEKSISTYFQKIAEKDYLISNTIDSLIVKVFLADVSTLKEELTKEVSSPYFVNFYLQFEASSNSFYEKHVNKLYETIKQDINNVVN